MTDETTEASEPATPFHDLDAFLALPRLGGLVISPDGSRLVTAVQELSPDRKKHLSALWEIDPTGERAARRLTRSAKGESFAAFLPGGDLVFGSVRPDTEAAPNGDDDEKPALWLLPARGGEARRIAERPGGIAGVAVANEAGTLVLQAGTMPDTKTAEEDADRRKARKDHDVNAILHQGYPIRYWDHDLGPDEPRLFAAAPPDADAGRLGDITDLTPTPGRSLDQTSIDITPDGRTVVASWQVFAPKAERRSQLVAIDTASGERRVLADDEDHEFGAPRVSPGGQSVVCMRERRSTTEAPPKIDLWLQPLDGSEGRALLPDSELWPYSYDWSPDGRAVFFAADENGCAPIFRVEVETGEVARLTSEGAYFDVVAAKDGLSVYAVGGGVDKAPAVVKITADGADQTPTLLRGPAEAHPLPGRLTEVETTAEDGSRVRAWLALPEGASADQKAPLLLWIHGGPLASWNYWSWRWNPWLMVAKGYAVLLPDPALSTGYGQAFIERGWGRWGAEPFTDLMAITDASLERDDIDETHVAAMGGSFGGYMSNWVAGHTDRFQAIVTHASLWALDAFGFTTDSANYWHRELTPARALASSPHTGVDDISTPMLVIHGDRDYRVPIGEGLRLWYELVRGYEGDPADFPHRFLYFPDENHWILKPQQTKVWYETVFGFLGWHVFGETWERPTLL